ncbi:polycomb protein Pcl isoform X2 [Cylas formicarius]|uniref:polycomb protein Pcl isoform X2 n=1 Tax=Cylas formicarius TaxID=197179 RepID=UPI0029587E94|nr:polycomb protein Pcl isoform X2 [Cylas formicarius]
MSAVTLQSFHSAKLKFESEETVVPDSTTQAERDMSDFCPGEDVLVKQKDGRYYFGTIVEADSIRDQCLVRFGDNTENWSAFKDVTKLTTTELEDLLCVICKKSSPKSEREISVCDQCGRGYHSKCHQPEIPASGQKEDAGWICKRCTDSEPHRFKKADSKPGRRDSRNSTCSSNQESLPTSTVKVLPYEINSLTWDTYHQVNSESVYCYCGGKGEWYRQMLQCGRCRQWFHEACIDSLLYPLYCGDRFYVFICAICNYGRDFVRRLELKWVDLVHLMLFNLTVHNCKKYYDLDTVVIPYISDNWHALQLPPKMANVTKAERRDNILSVLTNNRNRFKCGREIKKRTTIWGLRVRLPPPVPCVVLPPSHRRVTESELRELWHGNRRLQFLPSPIGERASARKIVVADVFMRNLMMGVAYQQNANHSETDSPCPSPEIEKEDRVILNTIKFPSKNDYLGAGCAKKTAPFKKMSLQRRKKLLAMTNRERDRILKRPRRLVTKKEPSSEAGTKRTASAGADGMPPTPPTSVSAPPTPPASNTMSTVSDLSNDFSESSGQTKGNKKQSLMDLELNTPCDTSSDETSSKSTLDLIIPPPKDFEGKNNPFLGLLRMGGDESASKTKKKNKDITLPLPLKTVIPGQPVMRPMKRQLSEKDIVIGPNGEIKRKKRFRRSRNLQPCYGGRTASKTATVVPARPDVKDWKGPQGGASASGAQQLCVDYTLTSRRLRQRPERPTEKEKAIPNPPTTPKPSPVKQEPEIDMEDLKSSVNIYFGAANRIAAGERFTVKAKRVGPQGKVECLIEWEGPGGPGGMT